MKRKLTIALSLLTIIAACSSSTSTNQMVTANYGLQANIGKVNYKITNELVTGKGCSGFFLIIPTGATEYVGAGIDTRTREGKAKAAAVYNALYGDKPGQLGMDIIAQPQFRVDSTGIPIIGKQVCATVIGYRAVIANISN
jgi:hypothetical protein